jgi:hypothetical protein
LQRKSKQNTRFMFNVFFENRAAYKKVEKYTAGQVAVLVYCMLDT